MKIRTIHEEKKYDFNYVYELDDEKGNVTRINTIYLDTATKVLKIASKKIDIRNSKIFEKFILNLKMSTRYYDKQIEKEVAAPSFMHRKYEIKDIEKYREKSVKYDKKAQALFSTHNGWYENLPQILKEIKDIIDENYEYIDNEANLLYTANCIDSVLNNYRKKQKVKTL